MTSPAHANEDGVGIGIGIKNPQTRRAQVISPPYQWSKTDRLLMDRLPLQAVAIAGLIPLALGVPSSVQAQVQGVAPSQPVTVAVKEITNNASGVWWWSPRVSKQLTDMLSNELKSTGNFTLVERQSVKQVLSEQELAELGITRKSTAPKRGMMTGAKYYVLGSVSDYQQGMETKSGGGGFNIMGFGQRKSSSQSKAYVALDIRVVDTTTGEIAYSRTIEGKATSSSNSTSSSGGMYGLSFSDSQSSSKKVPASKAVRAAMIEVSEYLNCVLYLRNSCIADYDRKEQNRREATKDVLEF